MARPGGATRALRGVLATSLACAGAARADEPRPDALETGLFEVGGLARGSTWFRVERGPFAPTPDMVNDEERPIYGGEGEEPVKAYGSVDEVIERLKTVSTPGAWEREGVSIAAQGPRRILVRGPGTLLAEVDRALEAIERDAFPTVVLDVVALPADAAAAWTSRAAEALGGSDLRVLACARGSGFPGQRFTAFSGGQRAYVADYDAEVASDAKTPDPIVLVQPDGLAVQAVATIAGPDVHLELSAWLARVEAVEPRRTRDVTLEVARVAAAEASASLLRVRPGAWTVLPASAEVSFAVRATVEPLGARAPSSPLPSIAGGSGPIVSRTWSASPLTRPRGNGRGPALGIWPSNYTAPEPPELREPTPILDADALVETVKALGSPAVWETDGAGVEARYDRLHARIPEDAAPSLEALLQDLARRLARTHRVDATVVSLPRADYAAAVAAVSGPGASIRETLAAREGAKVEGRASVRVVGDQRSAAFEGREHAYLADYAVEIAEKATIGNPILQRSLEGLALDVDAATAANGAAIACEVRCDRALWRSKRALATPLGDIELPDVAFQRVRGSFVAAPGTSRLLSLSVEGDRLFAVVVEVVAE